MAKSSLIRSLFIFMLSTTCVFFYACSDDEVDDIGMDDDDFKVSAIFVRDVQNNGNPSDISIQFNGGVASEDITEYRILFTLASGAGTVNASVASDLPATQYASVANTTTTYEESLSATQLDIAGEEIVEGEDYVVFILTVGTLDGEAVYALSRPSGRFQMINNVEVETLFTDFPANDGLFVTPDGTVLASNFGTPDNVTGIGDGEQVYSISSNGVEVFASGLASPMGGVMDAAGNYYLSSDQNLTTGTIKKVDPDGTVTDFATVDGWPTGLAIDASGNLYTGNFINSTISKITPEGTVSVLASDARLAGCVGIDTDDDGNVVTANFLTGDVFSINPAGEVSLIVRINGIRQGFGVGYMTIFQGAIYATGVGDHRIYKVTFDGTSEVFAGTGNARTTDGELLDASFSSPNGIAGDEANKILYISQFGEPGLRKIQFN